MKHMAPLFHLSVRFSISNSIGIYRFSYFMIQNKYKIEIFIKFGPATQKQDLDRLSIVTYREAMMFFL